jgi:hypothetical protein
MILGLFLFYIYISILDKSNASPFVMKSEEETYGDKDRFRAKQLDLGLAKPDQNIILDIIPLTIKVKSLNDIFTFGRMYQRWEEKRCSVSLIKEKTIDYGISKDITTDSCLQLLERFTIMVKSKRKPYPKFDINVPSWATYYPRSSESFVGVEDIHNRLLFFNRSYTHHTQHPPFDDDNDKYQDLLFFNSICNNVSDSCTENINYMINYKYNSQFPYIF